jgi:tRNA (guanine26-N2/guanine27-N2)-dimethyltransferase
VLASLSAHAARHRRYIVPLMSASIDFYNRIFLRVYSSAQELKKSASKVSSM